MADVSNCCQGQRVVVMTTCVKLLCVCELWINAIGGFNVVHSDQSHVQLLTLVALNEASQQLM